MDTAIYAGAAAAGVLLIVGVIVIIILWKRRKVSSRENGKVSLQFVTVRLHLEFSLSKVGLDKTEKPTCKTC